jgi:hypothetical protein
VWRVTLLRVATTLTGKRGSCLHEAKVEGIVPKAAWHWGSDSSVDKNSLG